jgi:hypothetical protein
MQIVPTNEALMQTHDKAIDWEHTWDCFQPEVVPLCRSFARTPLARLFNRSTALVMTCMLFV